MVPEYQGTPPTICRAHHCGADMVTTLAAVETHDRLCGNGAGALFAADPESRKSVDLAQFIDYGPAQNLSGWTGRQLSPEHNAVWGT
jgi:hypothetical protein